MRTDRSAVGMVIRMAQVPNSRDYRTTGHRNARARTFNHGEFPSRAGDGSSGNQASASSSSANAIFWLAVVLAVWMLVTHPLAAIGLVIVLCVIRAFRSKN